MLDFFGRTVLFERGNGDVIHGFMPQELNGSADRSSQFPRDRFYMREVFNNSYRDRRISRGFRHVMNLSDPLYRKDYNSGGSNPISSRRAGLVIAGNLIGGIHATNDGSLIEATNCNSKFVPDNSEFIRYKRLMAQQPKYNSRLMR